MRKLVLILIAFIAALTFIRDFNVPAGTYSNSVHADGIHADSIHADELHAGEAINTALE